MLDQLVEILGRWSSTARNSPGLLRLVLTQYSVGTIPATLDQVKVSELTRNDRHSVKRAVSAGGQRPRAAPAAVGRRPAGAARSGRCLQQRDILLSDAAFDPLDNELQNIYACLAQPSEHLTVSYPVTDHNGATAAALLCGASGWSGCFRA